MGAVPVWVWLPGRAEPVQAGELAGVGPGARFAYLPDYLGRPDAVALDPVELRLTRKKRGMVLGASDGLPGVVRDAKPAGYGADRLEAQAGRALTPLELLERGVPDGVGAIEVCTDITAKLDWQPKALDQLQSLAQELDAAAPASRALRRLDEDLDTSAGGERPKATLVHDGRLWLAKIQSRGDRPALPAREFVTMRLARMAGLSVAEVELHTFGAHQVLLVERFDRAGDPQQPQRRLYASAHTVLRLAPQAVRGDPQRSYLNLGDRLRIWARESGDLPGQLREVWRLAPAFDITPAVATLSGPTEDGPLLSMATGVDGSARTSVVQLLAAAGHLGLEPDAARVWLRDTAALVADHWEPMLRAAARPVMEDAARLDALAADARVAFVYGEWLATRSASV
ncbi:HipA domain-containing protein [Sphaerotilus montanus]|uniref:Serine/threonine-protein kinase HipA n=1 Tax=Sphaerotilus montanus TaxID=522889 RepID=A0A7Y9R1M3_9BURK|nr:HipA domain-containing protein [Sphaerotilus montanus]NYG33863.1 serine/threonine-protein kinase HipA [Sphaerotilus montanus]NZD59379.1 HipA domain-containing protein [Sphaerotilus montanus]